jgi:hypothetical protein
LKLTAQKQDSMLLFLRFPPAASLLPNAGVAVLISAHLRTSA